MSKPRFHYENYFLSFNAHENNFSIKRFPTTVKPIRCTLRDFFEKCSFDWLQRVFYILKYRAAVA